MKSLEKFNNSDILNELPSPKAGATFLLLAFCLALSSCGSFILPIRSSNKGDLLTNQYQEMEAKDFADHLTSSKGPFLSTPGVKVLRVRTTTQRYLEQLAGEIIGKNEIFFKNLRSAKVTILDTESPLYFSLPYGEVFLSKGLIGKYLKHESMLVSVLSHELVRSEKLLYPRETVVPVGYLPLERMITLNRLNLEENMEVHKWAYHLTVRSGYDGEYYLSWLQTRNRNTADFILQVGDANQISREESLFKAFLIKHAKEDEVIAKKNSSRSFYGLLNVIRDATI